MPKVISVLAILAVSALANAAPPKWICATGKSGGSVCLDANPQGIGGAGIHLTRYSVRTTDGEGITTLNRVDCNEGTMQFYEDGKGVVAANAEFTPAAGSDGEDVLRQFCAAQMPPATPQWICAGEVGSELCYDSIPLRTYPGRVYLTRWSSTLEGKGYTGRIRLDCQNYTTEFISYDPKQKKLAPTESPQTPGRNTVGEAAFQKFCAAQVAK